MVKIGTKFLSLPRSFSSKIFDRNHSSVTAVFWSPTPGTWGETSPIELFKPEVNIHFTVLNPNLISSKQNDYSWMNALSSSSPTRQEINRNCFVHSICSMITRHCSTNSHEIPNLDIKTKCRKSPMSVLFSQFPQKIGCLKHLKHTKHISQLSSNFVLIQRNRSW